MMHFSCSSSARKFLFATVALAVLSAPVAHASVVNLVSNPDFSGGSPSSGAGYGSISGWTFGSADSGSNNLNGPFNNGASLPAGITTAGFIQSSANLGNPTNAATTTLGTSLIAGDVYNYSFYFDSRGPNGADPGGGAVSFTASVGDQTLFSVSNPAFTNNYKLIQGSFVSDGSSSILEVR